MKTQEEYAREIDEIVLRDVKSNQSDWFEIDKQIFMLPDNKGKPFIFTTRMTGSELLILGGAVSERNINRVLGCLGNTKFYICWPAAFREPDKEINEVSGLYIVKQIFLFFQYQNWYPIYKDGNWSLVNIPK